jgi:hypothetical protein
MPNLNPNDGPDHDVIAAPKMKWRLIGLGAFALLIFGMIAHGNTLAAIALTLLATFIVIALK